MAGRVFISCGQLTQEERSDAASVAALLKHRGFDPYIAIEIQTLLDLKADIIDEIKRADYFLFINFRREPIGDQGSRFYRGSLFTNQELAIAIAAQIKDIICVNQSGALKEGMFGLIVANTPEFDSSSELLQVVAQSTNRAGWSPRFSRNLLLSGLRCGSDVEYNDHSTEELPTRRRWQRHCLGYVRNGRRDFGASRTMARLVAYTIAGATTPHPSPDHSNLKASGRVAYEHTIFPESEEAFDLFAVHLENTGKIFLNSEHDFRLRRPIISEPGDHVLHYEVFANGFEMLRFDLSVHLTDDPNDIVVSLEDRLRLVLRRGGS